MINEVLDVLVDMGITPQKQSPSLISFSKDGYNFVFQADLQSDPSYFRLMLPDIEPNPNESGINEKMISTTSHFKAAKCIRVDNSVMITVEAFSYEIASLSGLVSRWITLLIDMIKFYRNNGN